MYCARDERRGFLVALKIAHHDEARRTLSREAEHALLALSPRLPELRDVGFARVETDRATVCPSHEDGAQAFIALAWVDGTPLNPRQIPDDFDRRLLALQVAEALGEALSDLHGAGIAHGDVKPENVLLGADGRAHLLDLGLSCALHSSDLEGATPRYLARGDTELGDAKARDMIALGILLAELGDDRVAQSREPLIQARELAHTDALGLICNALLSPKPSARPSAAWVSDTAHAALTRMAQSQHPSLDSAERAERDARRVRASYLHIRSAELEYAKAASPDTAAWLQETIPLLSRVRALLDPLSGGDASSERPASPTEILEALSPDRIVRWLTAIVGVAAISWPVQSLLSISERQLAEGLVELARRRPPNAWTFADVEGIVLQPAQPAFSPSESASPKALYSNFLDPSLTVELTLGIAKIPPDPKALEALEHRSDVPAELVFKAADALRLQGEYGRARSLILRARARGFSAPGLFADILRRAGDTELSEQCARTAIGMDSDADGRASAVLARLHFDRRQFDEALKECGERALSPLCEVRALIWVAKGDTARALLEIERGEALTHAAESSARFAALRGYALHGSEPEKAFEAFSRAVDYAMRAGAVEEEATYRTGHAAAAVDLGHAGSAIATSTRAALLFEHLGRPALSARAWLARAAAHAIAGAIHEARNDAKEAILKAREASDPRAELYALWVIADISPPQSNDGRNAAQKAAQLNLQHHAGDELHTIARLLRHAPETIPAEQMEEFDRRASEDISVPTASRLDYWGARARWLLDQPAGSTRADLVLAALTALADSHAPIGTRGPALSSGYELALREGKGDIAQRLAAPLAEAARTLLDRIPRKYLESARALPWIARASLAPEHSLRPEQTRDLEVLVQSLSERERLRTLLDRVVDALVLWTGVERGLLLLKAPDDRLVPRAARNLARADLRGEQMLLSQSIAHRALEARKPIVAVDAAGELPSVHNSVRALNLRSVLAVPLIARGEVLGVVYLDDRIRRGAFGPRELRWAGTIASLAALAIADARDQVLLRRAIRRAKRISAEQSELLVRKEAELDAAERQLAGTQKPKGTRFNYDRIVGTSEAMHAMLSIVDRVTPADIPVLIFGESGSGKELIARAIHDNGPRATHRFVSENCGAIPESLLESALFGHVRGAFTGADRPRAGLFEIADQGTLFLDEIGEMSLAMQTKLLRVLEDGLVRPIGSERARKVHVRVIAATHRDLEAMIKAKTFREDLYYRLNIISIRIPPLRERPSDIPLLIHHFMKKHGAPAGIRITPKAVGALTSYGWPGNVRQLENEIRRAIVLCDGAIDLQNLSPDIVKTSPGETLPQGLNIREHIDALETSLIRDALSKTRGNQTKAAQLLGISRFGLQKMIRRLGLETLLQSPES